VIELEKLHENGTVVNLVNMVLLKSIRDRASDVHIEPNDASTRIRYRIDGVLRDLLQPATEMHSSIVSRIKVLAHMDIAERRLPQEGRVSVSAEGRMIDLRVSTMPTLLGEKVVIRILDKSNLKVRLDDLGFSADALATFKKILRRPYGMVLVTGPTGSGKTNTLYSAISQLNKPDTNILTAEDPVEFQLHGINQVQMKEQIGLNFAAALRSFLRQDPNIILVGEIRDFETAEIAIKAALTGHLVLSTLHTNDAPSTISRLMNMGIEPFLVATSVHMIVAQRLVRRICADCKTVEETSPQLLIDAGYTPEEAKTVKVYKGVGCSTCGNKGYKGRCGLYEVLEVTDELRELILVGASALELRKKAIEQGMISLRKSGLIKAALGQTTLEEVFRETVL
jgi:type IV pilus assembly protein PilB